MNKFAVFDIDGTLFRSSLYVELAFELAEEGHLPPDLVDTIALKRKSWKMRESNTAYQEFDLAVVLGVDQLLTTLPVDAYETAVARTIQKHSDMVYSYTRGLISTLKSQGYTLIAVSGSPKELVEQFASRYGFDLWVGQHWARKGNMFTGEIVKTHTDKDKIVRRLVEEHGLTIDGSYAIGDSEGDIGILSIVDNPIAFNPTRELIEAAQTNGWPIVIERKNICYTLKQDAPGAAFTLREFSQV
jgi:HAD superfamily hydrolase (TIGR01490 family)